MLWIMLQDKEAIYKVDNVYKSGYCIYSDLGKDDYLKLGRYESEERCIEVIESIKTHINNLNFANVHGEYHVKVFNMPEK